MDHLELAQLKTDLAADLATQAELDAEATLARNADNLTSGTVADARIASTIARDSEVTAAVAAVLTTAISDGDTTHAPDGNSVFDALALKQSIDHVWRIDRLLSTTPDTMSSGTWTNSGSSGFNTAGSSSTPYNEVWYGHILPGTWTFEVAYLRGVNGGIITYEYSLDGTNWSTIAASVDQYNAGAANAVASVAGVVVTAPSRFYLKVSSAGTKNASSSGYYAVLYNMTLRRTA